jgi:hypothetical protein
MSQVHRNNLSQLLLYSLNKAFHHTVQLWMQGVMQVLETLRHHNAYSNNHNYEFYLGCSTVFLGSPSERRRWAPEDQPLSMPPGYERGKPQILGEVVNCHQEVSISFLALWKE